MRPIVAGVALVLAPFAASAIVEEGGHSYHLRTPLAFVASRS